MSKLQDLRDRVQDLQTQVETLLATVESQGRDMMHEEELAANDLLKEIIAAKAQIAIYEEVGANRDDLAAGQGRKTKPVSPVALTPDDDPSPSPRVPAIPINRGRDNKAGFKSLGEMALSVARFATHKVMDPRLEVLAATTYGNESSGSEGGFAVPVDFRTAIMEAVMGEDSLLPRCDQIPVSGNTFSCPADMTTPWQSTGGIQAYWTGEAQAKTPSKPLLEERTVKLHKLAAIVPMTDELMEDASAMDAYLRRKAPEKIAFKVSLAIVQGNGVGMPLGLINSAALVSVAAEAGQQADTLVANNVIKMYSRMYAPSRSKAVWLINQDIEPMLYKLSLPGTDNTGNAVTGWGALVYMPANGVSGQPYATLYGRPVIPTQACETLGDVGDILFADLSQYMALIKSGSNPRVDTSMHFYFDQDITAFRFVLRIGGQPWWSTTIAARDGSATYSPYIALAAR